MNAVNNASGGHCKQTQFALQRGGMYLMTMATEFSDITAA